jgi:hypothetical protein
MAIYKKYWSAIWLYWSAWFVLVVFPVIVFIVSQILEFDVPSFVFGVIFFIVIIVILISIRAHKQLKEFYKIAWGWRRKEKEETKSSEEVVEIETVRLYKNTILFIIVITLILLGWFFIQWKSYLRCAGPFPTDLGLCWSGFKPINLNINGTNITIFTPNLAKLIPIVILHIIAIVFFVIYLILQIIHFTVHFKSAKFEEGVSYSKIKEDLIDQKEEAKLELEAKRKNKNKQSKANQYKINSVLSSLGASTPSYNLDSIIPKKSYEDELVKLEKEIKDAPLKEMDIKEEEIDIEEEKPNELKLEMQNYKIIKEKKSINYEIQPNI